MKYYLLKMSLFVLCLVNVTGCIKEYRLNMDVQGHRGCRGTMPENTLEGFLRALEMGVNTLEMDVVITGDSLVLVSHEAWFNHTLCMDPQGNEISAAEERKHNIFKMSYAEIQTYDCGSKVNPEFPEQEKIVTYKPLLRDVIAAADAYADSAGLAQPLYNIELKREPEAAGVFQPALPVFVELLLSTLENANATDRATIQAFEIETLQETSRQNPEMILSLLVDKSEDFQRKLSDLGFYPSILSPEAGLVDEDMMRFAVARHLKVIPWTVNDPAEIHRLIDLGVSGIVSDFPDRLVRVAEGKE